ncbi:hypothetical protein BO71DRAFT_472633 [Aspergillus ellipticus CBS 707.79]|uniref:Alpha/beta-hydrolase n=1 Tax=Aspergillus ellipticus CBS 707.79 TaxID=1448320 RepID=A0A319CRW3_9EURO|nr:hypothetical protein BO71DRAFT_472633 [Aspergillus ellipticus CBS 707.79]
MSFSKNTALAGLVALGALQGVAATPDTRGPPTLVDFDDSGLVGGIFYPPTDTPRSRIGVYVMHAEQDYLDFVACTELPKRGFTTFCANNDASKSGYMNDVDFEDLMTQVGTGLDYMRNNITEIDKVVILGHSGGGAMMAAYQNIAENGQAACNGSEKIYPCSDAVADLPAADGLMLIDCNYGLSTMSLLSLNPAIVDENNSSAINEALNLYNPATGFVDNASSNYTASFKKAFQSGVVARNNKVIAHAEARLKAIEAGQGIYSDDEPLTIIDADYIGFNNKFFAQDTRWIHHTTHAWPLLHKNGTTTQIVPSVRVPTNFESWADTWEGGALKTTVRRYLSTFAIRATEDFNIKVDGFDGIVWNSSQTSPLGNVGGITVPLLTMGMTGHYEYLNAEKLHLAAGSKDASIAFVAGAQHTINTCTACESYPGEFGNTIVTAFNHIGEWLAKEGRFLD